MSQSSDSDFGLARYNPDGSLDGGFDGDGKVVTGLGEFDRANAVAIQADRKIVVAGSSGPGGATDFALARYNPDGSLDASFDGDGKLSTDFSTGFDGANAVAIQADGCAPPAGRCACAWATTSRGSGAAA